MGLSSKILTTDWDEWNNPDRAKNIPPIGAAVGAGGGYLATGSGIGAGVGAVIALVVAFIAVAATD
jgi:hypothetical protein